MGLICNLRDKLHEIDFWTHIRYIALSRILYIYIHYMLRQPAGCKIVRDQSEAALQMIIDDKCMTKNFDIK